MALGIFSAANLAAEHPRLAGSRPLESHKMPTPNTCLPGPIGKLEMATRRQHTGIRRKGSIPKRLTWTSLQPDQGLDRCGKRCDRSIAHIGNRTSPGDLTGLELRRLLFTTIEDVGDAVKLNRDGGEAP